MELDPAARALCQSLDFRWLAWLIPLYARLPGTPFFSFNAIPPFFGVVVQGFRLKVADTGKEHSNYDAHGVPIGLSALHLLARQHGPAAGNSRWRPVRVPL
jgi:hypothetical protein